MVAVLEMRRDLKSTCTLCPERTRGLCGVFAGSAQVSPARNASQRNYKAGEAVCNDDKRPDFIGVVVSGHLRVQSYRVDGRRHILSILSPGDLVDEHLGPDSQYSIVAATDARVCRFQAHDFDRLIAGNLPFVRAVHVARMSKLDQLRALTWIIGALSVEERICAFLAMSAKSMPFTPLPNGGGVLTIEVPRQDIADLLGTSVESISRVLGRLDAMGVIRSRNTREFEIPNLDTLARMGGVTTAASATDLVMPQVSRIRMKGHTKAVSRHFAREHGQERRPNWPTGTLAACAQPPDYLSG